MTPLTSPTLGLNSLLEWLTESRETFYILDYQFAVIKEYNSGAPGWLSWLNAQLLISAQVTILWFTNSSAMLDSVLTTQSLLEILSLPLSLPLPCSRSCPLSLALSFFLKNK